MSSVTQDLVELAATVALLRRPDSCWPEIALDILTEGSATKVLRSTISDKADLFTVDFDGCQDSAAAALEIQEWMAEGIQVLSCLDRDYPAQLRDIREMPPVLFVKGTLVPDQRAVAVVGSRSATSRGLQIARTIASELTQREITVVSGLARGIDTAAHEEAIQAGGRTVAVIGTGIRKYYPSENRTLQDLISKDGLLISQFWPDTPPSKTSFPMRNAVMSGYAAMTIVVEAGERSGARTQARLALKHGRPVILTNQVMQHSWAQAFAKNPGVHAVNTAAEMLEAVERILDQSTIRITPESCRDLVIC